MESKQYLTDNKGCKKTFANWTQAQKAAHKAEIETGMRHDYGQSKNSRRVFLVWVA